MRDAVWIARSVAGDDGTTLTEWTACITFADGSQVEVATFPSP